MALSTIRLPVNGNSSRVETGWCLTGCLPPARTLSSIVIDNDAFVIGRRPGVNLQVGSVRVSGRHAEILRVGEHLFIRDLGSTNGTFVNRRRVRQPTPIGDGDHIEIADLEFRLEFHRSQAEPVNNYKKTAACIETLESDWVLSQFDRLIREREVTAYYQPLVALADNSLIGYEALARSTVPGLENPGLMFQTAQMVSREVELSLICRQRALEGSQLLSPEARIFVNTHPLESPSVDLIPSIAILRDKYPTTPIVVEIHEGAVHDERTMADTAKALRDLGAELAYDDFGAGQARLVELVKVPPDYLKFDMCLIRNIDKADANQRRMLKILVDMARDIPTITLAEGIETREEAEVCRDIGFHLAQGYYFGKPMTAENAVVAADTQKAMRSVRS
jgi:EAL domain-containing protein (putative c-di-GMP-specific phosphodiesterase class I)